MSTSSLFGVESQDVLPGKLPTISQFIKKNKKPANNIRRPVSLCWIPGKFDNFTLQTDRFRVIINRNHPFYTPLQEFFANSETAETPMSVEITDWDKGSYMLTENKSRGMWQAIGNSGYRWVND